MAGFKGPLRGIRGKEGKEGKDYEEGRWEKGRRKGEVGGNSALVVGVYANSLSLAG